MGAKLLIERASWTLVDQGVVSAGNFLLNVLLARTLSEADYGKFVLFLGAIFILRTFDYSFISYPLSVRLCVVNDDERGRLLGNTALLTVFLSLVLVIVMALGTTLLEADNIRLPACLCFLCWQAQETSRRCLLADFRYRAAVAGDGTAYVGQALLIVLLAWLDDITLPSALYMMSATFAIGALVHASKLRFAWPDFTETRLLARENFSVGKWSLVNYQLVLFRGQLFPWVLAGAAGTAATASFQAGANIASHDSPDHPGHRQCYPPGRGSRAPHRGRHRRVARSLWLCPLRLGADPGHLRRSRSDAGAASADGLWAVIALPRRRHGFAAPRRRRRARLHRGSGQQDAARR